MLIWVASYPRSGNTLSMLTLRDAFSVGRRGSVFEDALGLDRLESVRPAPYRMPPELAGLRKEDLLGAIRDAPEPFFIKTHRPTDARDPAPAIYLVRDGRDAVVSYAHFVAEHLREPRFRFRSFEARLKALTEGRGARYGGWSEHVEAWRSRSAPTAVVRFEDLLNDPVGQVCEAGAAVGVELRSHGHRPPGFASLHEREPTMFRRGEVGAWRSEMPPAIEARFRRLHGDQLAQLGYLR